MPIQHLPVDSPTDKLNEALEQDGCVVIDRALDRATLDRLKDEMAPHVEAAAYGTDEFDGFQTKRSGMLVARSPTSRDLIMNPSVLDLAKRVLSHATVFQLHCTQIIEVGPGAAPQMIHRDQWAFDMFPFPQGTDTTFATMWALDDFTEENGATRVIPGSHKMADKQEFKLEDTEPAEMEAGSVLLYTGSLYHGAGRNQSDAVRTGLIVHYSLGWLRQEENQYLGVPEEVLQTLPEDLLRLMGYQHASLSLGFIDGGRDPIAVVRPEFERATPGIEFDATLNAELPDS